MGSDNELAELYDGLYELYLAIPDVSTSLWKTAISSVLFGDEWTADGASPYGSQQNRRNRRRMKHYRSRYGDGNRIQHYSAITVSSPRLRDRQYVDADTKLPVAPESNRVIPVHVTDTGLGEALRLLAEFPAEPDADRPGNGQPHPLDLNRVPLNVSATKSEVRFLHVSDTHLGYRNRIGGHGNTVPWVSDISTTDAFDVAVSHALELGVDAVIHTGDFLDHVVDSEILATASESLARLADESIPFYFILGSHDRGLNHGTGPPDGVKWLREQIASGLAHELTLSGTVVPGTDIQLFGVSADNIGLSTADDIATLDWDPMELHFQETTQSQLNVLCLHDGVTPYRTTSEANVDVSRLLNHIGFSVHCVLVGDEHRPRGNDFEEGYEFRAGSVPIRYTGPAVPISNAYRHESAFVTELTITSGDISSKRHPTYARTRW